MNEKGIPAHLIEEFCNYEEWHHCSSKYNIVKFYNPEYVLATFGVIKSENYSANDEAVRALEEYKNKKGNKDTKIFEDCEVEWIEWEGTRSHPKAECHHVEGAIIEHSGGRFVKIKLPNGKEFKKKIGANGFYVWKNHRRLF